MRISDWSSDVCSSDLAESAELARRDDVHVLELVLVQIGRVRVEAGEHAAHRIFDQRLVFDRLHVIRLHAIQDLDEGLQILEVQGFRSRLGCLVGEYALRSEEQTSELQSLMRNSYA